MEESADRQAERKKKVGVVGDKSRQERAEAGRESRDKDVDQEKTRRFPGSRKLRGGLRKAADDRGPKQRGVPWYLQRSSRTLPGISTRLVSMMRTHSRSSASRLRAAGDRGALQEDSKEHAAAAAAAEVAPTETRRGKGRDSLTSFGSLSPGPRGWAWARAESRESRPCSA